MTLIDWHDRIIGSTYSITGWPGTYILCEVNFLPSISKVINYSLVKADERKAHTFKSDNAQFNFSDYHKYNKLALVKPYKYKTQFKLGDKVLAPYEGNERRIGTIVRIRADVTLGAHRRVKGAYRPAYASNYFLGRLMYTVAFADTKDHYWYGRYASELSLPPAELLARKVARGNRAHG